MADDLHPTSEPEAMTRADQDQSIPSGNHQRHRVKVLVVGPVTAVGGIGQVARMSVSAIDPKRFDVATSDTTKDTPADRSLIAALWSHARRLRNLVRGLRTHKPDVVHLHTCSYLTFYRTLIDVMICRTFGHRYVLHIHGGLFDEFLGSLRGLRKAWVSRSLRRAERVIVLGERWRTNLTRRVAGMNISVLPNAIDMPEKSRSNALAERDGGVVFVGDLSEAKRVEDLIVAYASVPSPLRKQFPLHIIGGGTRQRRRHLRSLAQQFDLGDRIVFHGSLPHEQVREMLESANLFVLPSRAEGQPIALLEAMSAGVASVVTNVGAIPETVTEGVEAAIVEPCNPLQIAKRMRDLLGDAPRRNAMGNAARVRVEKDYSIGMFAHRLCDIWENVARRKSNPKMLPMPRLASTTFRSIL